MIRPSRSPRPLPFIILLSSFIILLSCQRPEPIPIPSLIPQPVSVVPGEESFEVKNTTRIVVPADNEELKDMATLWASQLEPALGYTLEVVTGNLRKNSINLELNSGSQSLGLPVSKSPHLPVSYSLSVTSHKVTISGTSESAIFDGLQTLTQLLPPAIESLTLAENQQWRIPTVEISDYPRFSWRGLLLDVSRHFFTKEEVLAYIDQMVKYKFNVLHLHLSDDQGWRVEIKSLPKLTEVGARRVPRVGNWWSYDPPAEGEAATYGGYYTHEDIRKMVQYAADRQVTILPEIDIPGHSLALIASYPELSNTGKQYPVNPGSRFYTIEDNTLDPSNEKVYEVLDQIFTEVAQLFPSEYIHIGGDECYKGFWSKNPDCLALMNREGLKDMNELQSYFIKRVEKILQSKGKKMIGWDEILEGGLAPDATVMSWRGMQGGIAAAAMGHKVVMTPTQHCYLDLYQGDPSIEPNTYSMLRLRDVYRFEPVPEGVDSSLIMGGQGNLWTESVSTLRHAEYMTWPRAMALAEVLWSPANQRNWNSFTIRMEVHFARFDAADIKYARSAFDPIIALKEGKVEEFIEIEAEIEGLDIYYSWDGSYPDKHYPKYEGPLSWPKNATSIKAVTYRGDQQAGRIIQRNKK